MATTARVIVETRHLDTDRRARDGFQVEAPEGEQQRRTRLVELVARLHPTARHRSYADGAATFLDRDHLIVAFYERRRPSRSNGSRRAAAATPGRDQDRLFGS